MPAINTIIHPSSSSYLRVNDKTPVVRQVAFSLKKIENSQEDRGRVRRNLTEELSSHELAYKFYADRQPKSLALNSTTQSETSTQLTTAVNANSVFNEILATRSQEYDSCMAARKFTSDYPKRSNLDQIKSSVTYHIMKKIVGQPFCQFVFNFFQASESEIRLKRNSCRDIHALACRPLMPLEGSESYLDRLTICVNTKNCNHTAIGSQS